MAGISPVSKRNICLFTAAILLTAFTGVVFSALSPIHYVTAILYGGILIAWSLTIKRRIIANRVRRYLMGGGMLILLLFFLHVARLEVAEWSLLFSRYLWYMYYFPFIMVPLTFFSVAYFIGKKEGGPIPLWMKLLILTGVALWIAIMTNEIHHLAFEGNAIPEGTDFSSFGPLYFAVLLWSGTLIVGALLILVVKCRHTGSRRLWFIPVAVEFAAVTLLLLYAFLGGAPQIFGQDLYHLQEVNGLLYIGLWEACIQISLIPSNMDYRSLFRLSDIDATLHSTDGTVVVRSARDRSADDPDRILVEKSLPVSGGSISWKEDHTEILRLNERLRETTEELLEENELIEEENRVRAETAAMEEKRRLYDKISLSVMPQLKSVAALVSGILPDTPQDLIHEQLRRCSVYGAYVKRRANLELLAEQEQRLPLGELVLSIRESFEYLALCGIVTEIRQEGETTVPAEFLLRAYELMERIFEDAVCGTLEVRTFSARALADPVTVFLQTDADTYFPKLSAYREDFSAIGASLSLGMNDDGAYLFLRYPAGAGEGKGEGDVS